MELVKLFNDMKEALINYSIIGVVMSVFTIIIKPFVSWKDTVRNAALTFIFSMLGGLCLEYMNDIPPSVRCGLAGLCGFFAVQINDIILSVLKKVEEEPERLIKKKNGE